jgi:hypothetical protein
MVDCPEHSLKSLLHKASSTKVRLWNTFFRAEACKHCYVGVSGLSGFLSDIARAEESDMFQDLSLFFSESDLAFALFKK